jgi:hypothetical protein
MFCILGVMAAVQTSAQAKGPATLGAALWELDMRSRPVRRTIWRISLEKIAIDDARFAKINDSN